MIRTFILAGQSNMDKGVWPPDLPENFPPWPSQIRCVSCSGGYNPLATYRNKNVGAELGLRIIFRSNFPMNLLSLLNMPRAAVI